MDDELRNKCIELYGDKFGTYYDRIQEGKSVGTISKTVDAINKIEQAKRVVEAERTRTWIKIIKSYLLTTTN